MAELAVSLVISALVQGATSVIRSNFSKSAPFKPRESSIGDTAPVNSLTVEASPGGPQVGIFGHRRVGGRLILEDKVGNVTYLVVAIAGAELSSLHAVYVDNALVTLDGSGNVTSAPWANGAQYSMKVRLYRGDQIAADAGLVAAFPGWTADHVGLRQAYAVIEINPTINSAVFDSVYQTGVPDFQFDVLGFKCYDPRNGAHNIATPSTWTYSSNVSIIRANYLIHELGLGLPTSQIDWTKAAASANIDDELVALKNGGTERRYSASVYWTTNERHEAVIQRLNAACAGEAYPQGSKWVLSTGSFDAPTATISPDDYERGGLQWSEQTPIASLVNGVRGQFISPAHFFEPRDFPAYVDAAARTADGRELWLDVNFDCITSVSQAQRVARILYQKARYGAPASVDLKFSHFDTVAGDVVSITDPIAAFTGRTYRVQSDELSGSDHLVSLSLEHEAASFYNWTAAADEANFQTYDPVLGEPGSLLPPGGILFDGNATAGQVAPFVRVLYSPSPDVAQYRIELVGTLTTGTPTAQNFTSVPPANQWSNAGLIGTVTSLRVRAESLGGARVSAWTDIVSSTVTLAALDGDPVTTSIYFKLPAPGTPYLLSSSGGSANIRVKANVVDRADQIELRTNTTNDPATSTLVSTLTNVDSTQTVSGTSGTVRFYWTRLKNAATGTTGGYSNPILVAF